MSNSNLADISAFEQLQTNQHTQTGVSQMAVFNDVNSLKKQIDEYIKRRDLAQQRMDESNRLQRESKILSKTITSEIRKEYEVARKIEDKTKRDEAIAAIETLDEKFSNPSR
jgi:phage terminase small subunit